jgi:hypothetical protein
MPFRRRPDVSDEAKSPITHRISISLHLSQLNSAKHLPFAIVDSLISTW